VSTTIRVVIVITVVAAINIGAWMARLSPGNVVPPARDIRQIPQQLGEWRGENVEIDEYAFRALGAARDDKGEQLLVNRAYRNSQGEIVSFHSDVFFDYGVGIFHEPKNCFRANGYHLVGDERPVQLEVPGGTIEARIGLWERNGEFTQVLYWYQLGDNIVHDRGDLGSARWALRGKTEWPSLVKFLLLTRGNNAEAEARVKNVAEQAIAWFQSSLPESTTAQPKP
jgi:hypothetical protein